MADYRLDGLNWREFEHIVQTIATNEVASGVRPFGDGKDGGREAIFEGRMDFPSKANPWEGYLVLQCKFRQQSIPDTAGRLEWIKRQLAVEVRKYTDRKRNLKRPDYFLFATNLSFSSASGGGKDQLEEILEEFRRRIGAKGVAAWTYNELCRYIDKDASIRKAYLGFITPGDVLAAAFEYFDNLKPDFQSTIAAFLQKQLLHDRSAKLESAGTKGEHQIPLATVFVDLPATIDSENVRDSSTGDEGNESERDLIVRHILHACGRRTNTPLKKEPRGRRSSIYRDPASRFVIVGGPGQGKSTVGQYICQLFRAAIIKERVAGKKWELPDVWKSIELIEAQQRQIGADLPSVRRFPIRIILNEYAAERSRNKDLTLLRRIQQELSRLGGSECSLESIKSWLREYPWVVVFDGLDEVPASSNRSEVIREIEDFRVDIASIGADVVIVCTTRPQSYSQEFPEDIYQHWYLLPLKPDEALVYAQRLVDVRYPQSDDPRRAQIMRRLGVACGTPMTQKLMRSPLQVTIMATLVEHLGEPPRQRYTLFQRYYQTIYDREIGREGGSSAFLSARKADIDTIHYRVGLLLQRNSEIAGLTDARLSNEQFERLFADYLSYVGYSGAESKALMDEIALGSFERLVFLIRPTEKQVAFELRSLQEYMAAEALFQGPESMVIKRLQAIAPVAHWRNVLLFAIGKCFQDRTHLLADIHAICNDLNDRAALGSDLANGLMWGSRLALDILQEGVAQTNKRFHRLLAQVAMRGLETSDEMVVHRLAAVYHMDLDDLYRDSVEKLLSHSSITQRKNGWILCGNLAERGCPWAKGKLAADWDVEPSDALEVLQAIDTEVDVGDWWLERLIQTIPVLSPRDTEYVVSELNQKGPSFSKLPEWLQALSRLLQWGEAPGGSSFRRIVQNSAVSFLYCRIGGDYSEVGRLKQSVSVRADWEYVQTTLDFLRDPSPKALSTALRAIAAKSALWEAKSLGNLWTPWPLATCLYSAASQSDLIGFAERSEKGFFGSADEWRAAEQRWERGLTPQQSIITVEGNEPIDVVTLANGICPFAIEPMLYEEGVVNFEAVASEFTQHEPTLRARWLATLVCDGVFEVRMSADTESLIKSLRRAMELALPSRRHISIGTFSVPKNGSLTRGWITFLNWLGSQSIGLSGSVLYWEELLAAVTSEPQDNVGVLPLLATAAAARHPVRISAKTLRIGKQAKLPIAEAAAFLMAFASDTTSEDIEWASETLVKSPTWPHFLTRAFSSAGVLTVDRQGPYEQVTSNMLASVRKDIDGYAQIRSTIIEGARQAMNARRSALTRDDVWMSLELPQIN